MHHEVLDVYLLYLLPYVEKITVFTTSAVKNLLSEHSLNQSIEFHIYDQEGSFNDWLSRHSEILGGAQVCIVTTHQISLKEFVDPSKMNNPILVVHNTFSTFYPYKHLHLGKKRQDFFYDVLRLIRNVILGYERGKKQSLYGYRGYIATSEQQYNYVSAHFPALKDKFITGSLSYFLKFSKQSNPTRLKIVIPGTVDVEVRDYETVYEALKRQTHLSTFELILLGKIKNKKAAKIVQKFLELREHHHMSLITFDDTIKTEDYNHYLFNADLFIIPNRQIIRDGISYSVIGKSSISGTVADAFLYAQPCLVPEYLIIPSILSQISETYNGIEELAELLKNWKQKNHLEKVLSIRKKIEWEQYEHQHIGRVFAEDIKNLINRRLGN